MFAAYMWAVTGKSGTRNSNTPRKGLTPSSWCKPGARTNNQTKQKNMKEVRIYRILAALSALLAALADRAEQLKNAYLAGAVSGGAARRQPKEDYKLV